MEKYYKMSIDNNCNHGMYNLARYYVIHFYIVDCDYNIYDQYFFDGIYDKRKKSYLQYIKYKNLKKLYLVKN